MYISKNNQIFKKIKNLGVPCNNSKNIKKTGVFFVIKGEKTDGSFYIKDVIKKGASAIVAEKGLDISNIPKEVLIYIVPDCKKAYSLACSESSSNPSAKLDICGITGTNGKTSIAYMLKEIWKDKGSGLIGTIGSIYGSKRVQSELTTPDAYELNKLLKQMKSEAVRRVFLEVSSHSLELSRVEGISFNSAIFTNMSRDHLDFHKTMNKYYKTKSKLFFDHLVNSNKKNRIAVINLDDKYGRKIVNELKSKIKTITYSITDKRADFYLKEAKNNKFGTNLIIKNMKKDYSVDTKLFGNYNFENILAAFAFSKTKGLPIKTICKGIKEFNGAPGRLEKIYKNIFIDYAHTPDALKKSIVSLKQNFPDQKLTVLFGCGGDRDKGKRYEMGRVSSMEADKIIVTSDNPRYENPKDILKGIVLGVKIKDKQKVKVILNRREAIKFAVKNLEDGDQLLITGKGHEEYQDIKGKKYKFSDKVEIKKCLKKRF